jgi:hypothetical protein
LSCSHPPKGHRHISFAKQGHFFPLVSRRRFAALNMVVTFGGPADRQANANVVRMVAVLVGG